MVPGVGFQRRRLDPPRDTPGPVVKRLLGEDGNESAGRGHQAGNLVRSVDQGLNRMLSEFPCDEGQGDCDEQGDERLDLAVAVGVLLVGRRDPVAHAEDDGEVGHQVRDGVNRVRDESL